MLFIHCVLTGLIVEEVYESFIASNQQSVVAVGDGFEKRLYPPLRGTGAGTLGDADVTEPDN
ncbi:protein of unknown function [Xenorhabdus bovienii]|uniref:Uncharacterized protein n=1 Tax=Xenorhabdus bovienii TaxID=40576 RepID=A0A0B6XB70_XENBV|nr:protein of unknown function [Xenorhabdus bovienii]